MRTVAYKHVVQTWDESDSRGLGVVAASMNDRLLAVARRYGTVEVCDRFSWETIYLLIFLL
ncbi:hypothetical protein RchiOBHm_Chr3g0452851 [Rosa chinensis]|uniref:Uncharacterized protein n=1 Tax=Rosa chinensis TaxID=74649 RepID=A0A2P6R6E5_ROSCH|nr:hypothetical protein RchiOBHm_Chr3g0452851 [Rosa chinensis]